MLVLWQFEECVHSQVARRRLTELALDFLAVNAPPGMMSSLKISLTPSAAGCNNPHGPTRLGPLRCCRRAISTRSSSVV